MEPHEQLHPIREKVDGPTHILKNMGSYNLSVSFIKSSNYLLHNEVIAGERSLSC